jgi:hypothetical protein
MNARLQARRSVSSGTGLALVTLLGSLGLAPAPAWALTLEALGGVNLTNARISGNSPTGAQVQASTSPPPAAVSGGFGVLTNLWPKIDFEADLLIVTRQFTGTTTMGSIPSTPFGFTQTQHMYELPLLLRYYPSPIFSLGGGVYYAKYYGQLADNFSLTNGSTLSTNQDFGSANQTTSDFGLVVGVRLDMPFDEDWGFVVDGRLNWGLSNNSTQPGFSLRFSDVQLMAGLRFSGL